ncbi:uncharacterized protein KY384_007007 [Bacidia gigantensis]|uniref:uncharacterized protein n=1 Tax=Bacidia gigantensis TaxID=2732470 RepID=UPI001D04E5AB|nr:uncharacterized protein KY384_007007 [Bacidia gigantensis]KAG8528091.1 hypothetical protein KY384_007007 [Bacidia gigantensis]
MISRVNSTQSLRIRNLEGEVSRLLAENVSLREQIIRLHYEVENAPGRWTWDKIEDLKEKLESKLHGFNDILKELGEVKRNATSERSTRRKSVDHPKPQRSPSQRQRKNNLSTADTLDEADGRLPTIVEDKRFPRQTLDVSELRTMITGTADLTDSPDIGSPPIAHFEEADPVKFDHRAEEDTTTSNLAIDHSLRRKRRESFHQDDANRVKDGVNVDEHNAPVNGSSAVSQVLKFGPKRKLSHRDQSIPKINNPGNENLTSSRKALNGGDGSIRAKADSKTSSSGTRFSEGKAAKERAGSEEVKPTRTSNTRQPLGPKNTNSDPQSPVKLMRDLLKDKAFKDAKESISNRVQNGGRENEKPAPSKAQKNSNETQMTKKRSAPSRELPPKTPTVEGLDLLSPTISDPSEPRPERGDTPPPPDLGANTGIGSFGRASRRSKSSVSYAEPNLRDKMRRPTKDFVDAVTAEDRMRQAANLKRENSVTSIEGLTDLRIKDEDNSEVTGPIWTTKPIQETRSQLQRQEAETSSPLSQKTSLSATDLPTSVATDRRRRASAIGRKDDGEQHTHGTGAADAITALVNGAHRRQRLNSDEKKEPADTSKPIMPDAATGTSIFDFTSSSPEDADRSSKQDGPAKPTRVSRRHSTAVDPGKSSITISRRRRGTFVDNEPGSDKGQRVDLKLMKSMTALEPVASVGSKSAAEVESFGRAASRRRSMML